MLHPSVCMNTGIPVNIKARAFYYREKASYMYSPEPYALANFLVEIPWLAFIILTVITVREGLRGDSNDRVG